MLIPMLTDTFSVSPFPAIGASRPVRSFSATTTTSCSRPRLVKATTNSSPPMRATMSLPRTDRLEQCIAGFVAVRIVDRFETVEIQK